MLATNVHVIKHEKKKCLTLPQLVTEFLWLNILIRSWVQPPAFGHY